MKDQPRSRPHCGFLCIAKPGGVTSRAVVNQIERALRPARPTGRDAAREHRSEAVKVGHAGTLDPLATGVLVLAVGAATRLIEVVQQQTKTYRALVRLGMRSETWDADGTITATLPTSIPERYDIERYLGTQLGEISQPPPPFSALKVGGQRAHELARRGEEVVLAPRTVRIDRITIVSYQWPDLRLEIDCGSGTYIRSIAHQLGEALGCGGLIAALERTRIGRFRLEDAMNVPSGSAVPDPSAVLAHLLPPEIAVADWPCWRLTPEEILAVVQGRALVADPETWTLRANIPRPAGVKPIAVALMSPENRLVAVADYLPIRDRLQPKKVLIAAEDLPPGENSHKPDETHAQPGRLAE